MVAVSCSEKGDTFHKLEQAEALTYSYDYSSANQILNSIDINDLDTKELRAFYNLLKTEILFRCENIQGVDSLINVSIEYYKRSGDKEKLATAYYIRALQFFDVKNEKALIDLKEAETIVEKTDNLKLKKRIYAGLTILFGNADEFPLSLQYALKEYACAEKIGDKKTKAYTLLNLSVSYDRTGQKDSAAWCIHECEKLANVLEPYYQAYMYYGLGSAYANSDVEKAEEYLKKSIELEPLPQAYTLLSDIYVKSDRAQMAEKMWTEVMQMPWDEFKVGVLDAKLEYDYQNHDFEEYCDTQKEKSEAMVRYYEKRLKNKADELGRKYDLNLYRQRVRSRTVITILIVAMAVAVLVFLSRIRIKRIENKKMELELNYAKSKNSLTLMEKRISDLETDKKRKTSELSALKSQSEKLKAEIQKNLRRGRDLFDSLDRCESPINWTDNDLFCLFDYVSTISPEFILSLDSDYNGLNEQQKLFLLVSDFMKKQDHELCVMFNLEKDSLRNKRNRIAKKRMNL